MSNSSFGVIISMKIFHFNAVSTCINLPVWPVLTGCRTYGLPPLCYMYDCLLLMLLIYPPPFHCSLYQHQPTRMTCLFFGEVTVLHWFCIVVHCTNSPPVWLLSSMSWRRASTLDSLISRLWTAGVLTTEDSPPTPLLLLLQKSPPSSPSLLPTHTAPTAKIIIIIITDLISRYCRNHHHHHHHHHHYHWFIQPKLQKSSATSSRGRVLRTQKSRFPLLRTHSYPFSFFSDWRRSSQLAEPLWTDPVLKSGISVRELISTLKKEEEEKKTTAEEKATTTTRPNTSKPCTFRLPLAILSPYFCLPRFFQLHFFQILFKYKLMGVIWTVNQNVCLWSDESGFTLIINTLVID